MKSKLYLSIILIGLFFSVYEKGNAQAPGCLWAQSAGGASADQGLGVTTDASGNVLVTGCFASDSITFGATTLINTGSTDMFVVKYDAAGNVLWAKSNGGSGGNEYGFSITTDAGGNVLVAGSFSSTTLTLGAVTLSSAGDDDIFVVKYDASGNVLWAKRAGGNLSDVSAAITTDASGNVLVTGNFRSPYMMLGVTTLYNVSAGYREMFLLKYDAAGNLLWAKSAEGILDEYSFGIATDPNGNTRVTGATQSDTLTFGTTTLISAIAGNANMYIVNYDVSGNVLWVKSNGSTNGSAQGTGVTTYPNGNTLVTGDFSGNSITFDTTVLTNTNPGWGDIYVVKYDAAGNVLWAKSDGGNDIDYSSGIAMDAGGEILVTGYFRSTSLTFGSTTLYHTGGSQTFDAYVVKYDTAGNALWAQSAGGTNDEQCFGIATDAAGNVVVTGVFDSPSTTFGTTTLTNAGSGFNDVFVAKIGLCATTAAINPVSCTSYTSPSGLYTWTASGVYHDTIPNAAGCDSVITINLTINPLPVALYTLYPDTTTPHNWFALNQCTGTPPLTYVWNWGDSSAVSTGATPSHTYADSGYYNICVTVTDGNGCVNTYCDSSTYIYKGNDNSIISLQVVMQLPNGIDDIAGNSAINIYPVPVHDVLNVSLNKPLPANTIITISDMQGRMVGEKNTNQMHDSNGSVIPIDVSALSQGVYLLRVDGVVRRFVKM